MPKHYDIPDRPVGWKPPTVAQWISVLQDPKITTNYHNCLELLLRLLRAPNYTAQSSEIYPDFFDKKGQRYTKHSPLNPIAGKFGGRVALVLGIEIPVYYEENRKSYNDWQWNIPFTGDEICKGNYSWTLRDELKDALKICFPNVPFSQYLRFLNDLLDD